MIIEYKNNYSVVEKVIINYMNINNIIKSGG